MSLRTGARLGAVTVVALVLAACFGRRHGGTTCPDGTESCACYQNQTCNDGLVCLSTRCVRLDSEGNPIDEQGNPIDPSTLPTGGTVATGGTGTAGTGAGGTGSGGTGTGGTGTAGVTAGTGTGGVGVGGTGAGTGVGGTTGGTGTAGTTAGTGAGTSGADAACIALVDDPNPSCSECFCASCVTDTQTALGNSDATFVSKVRALLECSRATCCANTDCYCGVGVDLITCVSQQTGPCKAEVESAAGSTDPLTIANACATSTNPCGAALLLSTCVQGNVALALPGNCPACVTCD